MINIAVETATRKLSSDYPETYEVSPTAINFKVGKYTYSAIVSKNSAIGVEPLEQPEVVLELRFSASGDFEVYEAGHRVDQRKIYFKSGGQVYTVTVFNIGSSVIEENGNSTQQSASYGFARTDLRDGWGYY